MTRRRKDALARPPAASQQVIHPNATLGPEASEETSTEARYFPDATSSANLAEQGTNDDLAESNAALVDKYFLSGKRRLPISQIAFILLLAAIGWIFIQDNSTGAFGKDDWGAVWWTIQKSFVIVGVFIIAFVGYFLFSKIARWLKDR